jgi:hypothetical protein
VLHAELMFEVGHSHTVLLIAYSFVNCTQFR